MELLTTLSQGEILLILVTLLVILIPVYAIIDIAMHDFRGNDKIFWLLIVLFIPLIGSAFYLMVGRFKKISDENPD